MPKMAQMKDEVVSIFQKINAMILDRYLATYIFKKRIGIFLHLDENDL
jgi:hypothetical protein